MKEQGVIWLSILNQPLHSPDDVGLGGLTNGILLIVGQGHHILRSVSVSFRQKPRHIVDIVDTALELVFAAKVIDANQKRLSFSGTVGVLKRVLVGCAMAEALHTLRNSAARVRLALAI